MISASYRLHLVRTRTYERTSRMADWQVAVDGAAPSSLESADVKEIALAWMDGQKSH